MSKPELIIIGAGGHAHACIDVIEQQGKYQIAGLVGKLEEMNAKHLGYEVIAVDENLSELAKQYRNVFVAVGQIQSPDIRIALYQRAATLGFNFPIIISPHAHVSNHAIVGPGTIVMHGALVNAGAKIGSNCIINTHALIEHDVVVEDNSHISTGAILNGNVIVGEGSFVGSGSILKEGVSLGKRCIVGMGLSVRRNQAESTRFDGQAQS